MPSDRAMNTAADACVDAILGRYGRDPVKLLQILIGVQECCGHVPPESASRIAAELRIPRSRIESVVSCYAFLHAGPPARYRVLFSDDITDRMHDSPALMAQMCRELWAEPGKVSEDGLVFIDTASCTGMCDQGPAMLVNGRAITCLTPSRIQAISQLIRNGAPLAEWPAEFFRVEDNIRRTGPLLDHRIAPGVALRAALAQDTHGIIEAIMASGLRGRGGAGFPTGSKWENCRNAPGGPKHVVCNADEGEPGTFKDRVLLTSCAPLLFEGMTLCALAIGARRGYLYLRGEYRYLLAHLENVLQQFRDEHLLGPSILGRQGFDFDIEIQLGAGAYICGEESALIESMEGKPGIPRNRPPFPVTHGYLQQPTVVDNVETFCQAILALHLGADSYRSIGTSGSSGSKLISVSGDCSRPGIYEYPFGVSVREVLQDCAAIDTRAVQVGGPSGICIAEHEFDRRLCFEDLPTAGAFMVFDNRRDMFAVARNFVHFFAHESCGFCTPCRVGTSILKRTLDKIADGHGTASDLAEVEDLDHMLQTSSHCGLGRTACNPVLHTLRHFRPAYESRLKSLDFEPGFDLDGALARARQMTGRNDAGAHLKTEDA